MSLKSWIRLDILHPGPKPNSARFQHRACLTHLSPPGFLSRALADAEAKVVLAAGDSGGDRELQQMVRLRLLHGVLCTCETRQELSAAALLHTLDVMDAISRCSDLLCTAERTQHEPAYILPLATGGQSLCTYRELFRTGT